MLRKIDNVNPQKIIELLEKIISGIRSMIFDYTTLYTDEELVFFNKIIKLIENQLTQLQSKEINQDELQDILKYEEVLKPFIWRCWAHEFSNGSKFVSWFKTDTLKDTPSIVSSTFSKDLNDTFCDARYGISYDVLIEGFLGACNKDAATLITDSSQQSIYTVGELPTGKIVNSYNLATPIITPVQAQNKTSNQFQSKHNEIILDSRFIKPISVVYNNENDIEMVSLISSKYNIPIEKIKDKEL